MQQAALQEMLVNVQNAKPEEVVKQVEALFASITQMTPDAAVAAYQTIEFLTGASFDPRVRKVKDAIVNRMKDLARQEGCGSVGKLYQRFHDVVTAFRT